MIRLKKSYVLIPVQMGIQIAQLEPMYGKNCIDIKFFARFLSFACQRPLMSPTSYLCAHGRKENYLGIN